MGVWLVAKKWFLRPTSEDIWRGIAYLMVLLWAVLFTIFPAVSYIDALDQLTRSMWLGACGLGALAAAIGAFFRVDLKLELPGIAIMFIGPMFYAAAQVWFLVFPDTVSASVSVVGRIPLTVYALLPVLLCLPRVVALGREIRRQRERSSIAAEYEESEG